MNLKLLACLACSAALLLGACSSNNSSGTSSTGGGNGNSGTSSGTSNTGGGNGNGGTSPTESPTATELRQRAVAAVGLATTAVESGDAARARQLIQAAEMALTNAVNAANNAVRAAADRSAAEFSRASRVRDETTRVVARQREILEGLEGRLSWFGKNLVREAIARRLVRNPGDGANTADIERIPRTRDVNGDGNQQVNPDAFDSDTFQDIMYSADDMVFSDSGDEFKVDGYVMIRGTVDSLDESIYTGVKLTNNGLVIRTGGTDARRGSPTQYTGDFTDMRKDITTWESDSNDDASVTNADGISGQNGWDLAITFKEEPRTVPVSVGFTDISDPASNWRGNNAFYWRSLVPADDSQKSGGDNYQADAFIRQPEGQENLGIYEVWLSNSVGVNRKTEPSVRGTRVVCPDGSEGTRCPDDDEHRYLSYAAYGLFVYSADTNTFCNCPVFNGQLGRINTMHFGYSAFSGAAGQSITDIGEPITGGTFTGYTLAVEIEGAGDDLPVRQKLLRGDVSLTVTIPKGSGTGSLYGTMNNFERWDEGGYWADYTQNFQVRLSTSASPATINPNGTFKGTTTATPAAGLGSSGAGEYKGSFYGPRAERNDLEIAGSWTIGSDDTGADKDLYGSFGAKQNIASN